MVLSQLTGRGNGRAWVCGTHVQKILLLLRVRSSVLRTLFFEDGTNDKHNPTSTGVVNCNEEYFPMSLGYFTE